MAGSGDYMINISAEQIAAAKDNDLEAVSAVLRETEERVNQIASKHARGAGGFNADLMDDLAQVGRIAVWEAVGTFDGASPAEFFSYINKCVSGAISSARMEATREGVSRAVATDFEAALVAAGGDPIAAEKYACSDAMGKRKMSPEMAHVARLSWQGLDRLDLPIGRGGDASGDAATVGSLLPDPNPTPEELVTAEDRESERRQTIRVAVHSALGKLGPRARQILKGTYGISGDVPYFGPGHDAEFALWLGMVRETDLRAQRANAKKRFRTVYLAGEAQQAA